MFGGAPVAGRSAGLYCHPDMVLEGICEPRCRIGFSFGGWKSCQLTTGRIQARTIGRIADIRNPNGRRAQALRALAVAKFRGTDACCPGAGHGVSRNAWLAAVKHRPAGSVVFLWRLQFILTGCTKGEMAR